MILRWTLLLRVLLAFACNSAWAVDKAPAKSEPQRGCFVGAFVGPDPSIRREMFRGGGELEDALARIIGKRIAVEMKYFRYDDPQELNAYLTLYERRHPALQVVLDPAGGLKEVRNDALLAQHALNFAAHRRPIFLRFASEMNGPWSRYHADPALYREKFRLVHDVMAKLATNVIMVWCVAAEPRHNWEKYYPGDRYVDWVGINIYSVLHHNGDPSKPAYKESPLSSLDPFYRRFAGRKPIAICEYGATREERLAPGVDRSDFAAARFAELLGALPRQYPRVKLVTFFNVNTMQRGFATRSAKVNNYCFSSSPVVASAIRRALVSSHYLDAIER